MVAADKGAASFSDIANEIAVARGFWLDDAFASGSSAGYDLMGMGITARQSIKRRFRELGTDIQSTPFTVAGIGDMSGDVFGNGTAVAADPAGGGVHIAMMFLDPEPDAARERDATLFRAPAGTRPAELSRSGDRQREVNLSRRRSGCWASRAPAANPVEVIASSSCQ